MDIEAKVFKETDDMIFVSYRKWVEIEIEDPSIKEREVRITPRRGRVEQGVYIYNEKMLIPIYKEEDINLWI